MRPLLRLIRFPLFVTALADSAAGYLIAIRATADITPQAMLLLAGASAFLYCAGIALNDLADRVRDRALHPARPLPSGAVAPGGAVAVAVLLLAAGAACAGAIGRDTAGVAALMILTILLYNFGLKRWRLPGAAAVGLVRAVNMAMGMTAARAFADLNEFDLAWSGILFVYVALTTLLSTFEEGAAPRAALIAVLAGVAGICCVPSLAATHLRPESAALSAILVAVVAARAVVLFRRPVAAEISTTVGVLVLGIVPLDASILLGLGMAPSSLAVMSLLPVAMLAGWSFRRV